jgi:hypothetical protein
MRKVIGDCLARKSRKRPSFEEILFRRERIRFKRIARVNYGKVRRFVEAVKQQEKAIVIEIDDLE